MPTPYSSLIARTGFEVTLLMHGETIEYNRQNGDPTITRKAVVDRQTSVIYDQVGQAISVSAIVTLHNNAAKGIDAASVNAGGDHISFAEVPRGPLVEHSVYQLIEGGDGGTTRLAIR